MRGVYEYDLRFHPAVDSVKVRHKLLNSRLKELGGVKMYDGSNVVYLPIRLDHDVTEFECTHPIDASVSVTMVITYKKKKQLKDCIHLINVLFKRIMKEVSRIGHLYLLMFVDAASV